MQEQTPVKIDSYQAALRAEMGWYDLAKRAKEARKRAQTIKDENSRYKDIEGQFTATHLEEAIRKLTEEFRKNPAAPHLLDLCLRQGSSLLEQENYTDALKVIRVGLGYGSDQPSAPGRPQPGVAPNDTAEGKPFVGMEPSRLHTLRMLQAVAQILNAGTQQQITELVEQAKPLQSPLDQLELPEAVCRKLQDTLLAAYRNIVTDEKILAEEQSDALPLLSAIMQRLFPEQAKTLIKELEQRKADYHIGIALLTATRLQQQAEEQLNDGNYTRAGEYNKKALKNLQLLSEEKYVALMSNDKQEKHIATLEEIEEQEKTIEQEKSYRQLQTKLEQARESYTRMLQAGRPLDQPSEAAVPSSAQSASAGHTPTQAAGAEPGSSIAAGAATAQPGLTLDQVREQCAQIVKTANDHNFTELATEATELLNLFRQFQSLWEAQHKELEKANAMLQAARLAGPQLAIELANQTIQTCGQIQQNIPDYANTAAVLSAAENLVVDRKSNLAESLEPPPGSLGALAPMVAEHLQQSRNLNLNDAQINELATRIADNIERPAAANLWQQWLPTMLSAASLLVLIVFVAVQAFNSRGGSGAVSSATASPTTTTVAAASPTTGDSDRGIQPWQTRLDYTAVVPTQISTAEENPAISEPGPTNTDEPTSETEPTTTATSIPAPTEIGTPPVTVTIDTAPFDRPELLFDLPLTITGTADPGSELTLTVTDDDQTLITATVSVDDNRNWTWNPPLDQPALAPGSYTLQVTPATGEADTYLFEVLEATRVSVPANVGIRDRCGQQAALQTLNTPTEMEFVGQVISSDDNTRCYRVRYDNQRQLYWIWQDALEPNQPDPTTIPELTEQPEPTSAPEIPES